MVAKTDHVVARNLSAVDAAYDRRWRGQGRAVPAGSGLTAPRRWDLDRSANRPASSFLGNSVSFSSARTLLHGPLRDQTHREFVYGLFQFHERSQQFIG